MRPLSAAVARSLSTPSGRRGVMAVGVSVAAVAGVVLAAWLGGDHRVAALVRGWRVMVPGTAFSFLCIGTGIVAAAVGGRGGRGVAVAAALAALLFPVFSIAEYGSGARWGIESWLGVPFPIDSAVAGRMSPLTALSLLLLAVALAALAWPSGPGPGAVRVAAGTTLAVSWLGVLAIAFDVGRLADVPSFPGMAVLTIMLLALSSAAIVASSAPAMARLHGARVTRLLAPAPLLLAFVVPLLFGQARSALGMVLDRGLAAAVVVVAFAAVLAAVVWRTFARLAGFQEQRQRLLDELEQRVVERTQALGAANRQLHDSERRLVDADRRKDEFLATLAHELRNPLAPIRTGLELLKAGGLPADTAAATHAIIGRQLGHLVRLIDDLLDVSRITANKLELRLERLSVADVLHQAVETARSEVDRGRHVLSVVYPPLPLMVLGDPTRLTQVVSNLLQNASRYTPPGGRIEVAASRHDDLVEIRVGDNGIGIAAEHLPRLFEKFSQVRPAFERGGGLGLGLALVRGLVLLHGGSVDVRSGGPGRGSEFVVRLPALDGTPAADPVPAADEAPAGPGRPRRVLVVDDNVDNADTLAQYLRRRGHLVETAYDGDSAWRAAARFRPDVVLLDIGLPNMTGHDVCRAIRAQPWGVTMRIVAQTGWGQDADRQRSRDAGFDDHLVKPVDPAIVADLVAVPR
ncbi:MAG: ATP-binding protein [Vicinamibacterales bacterium]